MQVRQEDTYLTEHVNYPNALSKLHPPFLATFANRCLTLAIQLADIECFSGRYNHGITSMDKVVTVKVGCLVLYLQ